MEDCLSAVHVEVHIYVTVI